MEVQCHVYSGIFFFVPYIYFYSTFTPHQINFKNMNLGWNFHCFQNKNQLKKSLWQLNNHSWNIVDSGVNTNKTGHHVIPDTLLKVSLNTNKTGQHVIRYTWPFNNVSVITNNMVTSFIGVECHFQQNVSYSVEHGDQFYWCLTTLSKGP
jgi:hypothetical protein